MQQHTICNSDLCAYNDTITRSFLINTNNTSYNSFMAITQVNRCQPTLPVENWRILLKQSFTVRMPLLTATTAFQLERKTLEFYSTMLPALWRGGTTGKAFGLAISRLRVQILLEATLRNNLRQVVYTYVPLSPSSITWYRPKDSDAVAEEVTAGLAESNGSLPPGG